MVYTAGELVYPVIRGAMSVTVNDSFTLEEPAALVAVTVQSAVACVDVGVPDMSPVVVLNERPPGRAGEIDHIDTAPPETTGVIGVTDDPFVKTAGEEE